MSRGRPIKDPVQPDFVFSLLNKISLTEKKLRGYAELMTRHTCQKELLLSKAATLDLVRDWIHLLLRGDSLEKDKGERSGDR
jgi:hypothetical protein